MAKLFSGLPARFNLILILALIPAVATLTLDLVQERQQALETAYLRAQSVADRLITTQDQMLRNTQRYLEYLADLDELREASTANCGSVLAKFLPLNPAYSNLSLVTVQGNVICSARTEPMPLGVIDAIRTGKRSLLAGFQINDLHENTHQTLHRIEFSTPIQAAAANHADGLLVAIAATDWWLQELKEAQLPEQAFAIVTDNTGHILAHYPTSQALHDTDLARFGLHFEPIVQPATAYPGTVTGTDGIERLFAQSSSTLETGNAGIRMAIGIEAQALFQQLNQHVLHHLIAVFIGFAVFYLIALWGLRRSVSRPLQALVEETLALEQGRLRQHTPVSGTREFVELIYRFRRIMQERNDSVSALYDSKQRLRSTLQRLSELINNSPLGIVEWDNRLHAQRWNAPAESLLNLHKSGRPGNAHSPLQMPSNHHIAAIRPVLKRLIKGEETSNQAETHEQHEDGSLVMLRWHNSARHDAETGQTAILSVIEDISAQETQQQRLAYQATHDALTGLANRVLLKERVNFVINDSERHHESAAIVLLDLDRFKLINDSLGHMTGDDLLCEAARRLTQLMRSHDTLGRLGGDEFLLILPGSQSSRRIEHLLNRILESFREPIEIDGRLHHVKISAGVSFYPQHSRDADTLIRQADMAMYAAKSSGGNCFRVFDAEMEQETQQRLSVENDLRTAIKDQQLELYLQPLVMTSDTGLWGAEALIRWNHPSHGLVLPNDFIPYAEESSLILEIGEFVMDQAHRIAGDWAKRGLDQLKICINLSARQFSEDALTSQLMALQETYACSPRQIILELTESTLLEAVQNNIERLNLIKALGYQLALDDFGTGYSSINHLSRFPIDILKIDRGFIDRSTHNETARALVSSMIQMGQRLKLQVIAEGVETREQMMMLKTEQCDLLQGFLFGKPIPIPQFEAQHIRQRRHAAHKPNRRIANL